MNEVKYKKIFFFSFIKIFQYATILTKCGKDMFDKYGLSHWHNSFIKNLLIVAISLLKNELIIGYNEGRFCCAFQIRRKKDSLFFSKLCTLPSYSSKGFGSQCLDYIEKSAIQAKKNLLTCEVYDKSLKAIRFYEKRGFKITGAKKTLKYSELIMTKEINL